MEERLPVFRTAGHAFRSAFSQPVLLSIFFIKCFLVYFVGREFIGFVVGATGTSQNEIAITVLLLPLFLLVAPAGVAVHRFIILEEKLPAKPFKGFFSKRNMEFGFIGLLFSIPVFVFNSMPKIFIKYGEVLNIPDWVIILQFLTIVYIFILVRIIIYLPFIAVGNKKRIGVCWRYTRGQNWRLFWTTFIVSVSIYLINKIIVIPLVTYAQSVEAAGFGAWISLFVNDGIAAFILFFNYILTVSVVSHAFLWLEKHNLFDMMKAPEDFE